MFSHQTMKPQQTHSLKHAIPKMTVTANPSPAPENPTTLHQPTPDSLSDETLLRIFSKLPEQLASNSLVCKRWLHLNGRLIRSLKVSNFGIIELGRVFHRFPNITDIDLTRACIGWFPNPGVVLSNGLFSVGNSRFSGFDFGVLSRELVENLRISGSEFEVFENSSVSGFEKFGVLSREAVDRGVGLVAEGYPNLRRAVVFGVGERGLSSFSRECETLQELEVNCCDDVALTGLSGCRNLQIVKLIGSVFGFYSSVISDIGLTFLAQGCRRLVRLELCGCEGSFHGIKAIAQCCGMLEELTFGDHRMDAGWLCALSFCGNLRCLRFRSCKVIDRDPGRDEELGCCRALEVLHLQQCQIRDKKAVRALFVVCKNVTELVMKDCWGMENDVFSFTGNCRRVRLLSLEGCSLLTVVGLESVILSFKELQMLRVESCRNIRDKDITPAMASLFSVLKELKWRPDSRSIVSSCLKETGIGNKGGRFFGRSPNPANNV